MVLWGLTIALLAIPLFATLADRPFSQEALRHFSLDWLNLGRRFTREAMVAATLESVVSLGVMAWLCFSEGGARLLRRLEALGKGRLWLELAAVAAGIALISALVDLPFDYYLGFVHERAYGLSKEGLGAWLKDYVLGQGLDLVLSLLIWMPLYWLIRRFPRGWWLPGAAVQFAAYGLLIAAMPVVVMPLFDEIVPVRDPQVQAMVQRLADKAGVEVEAVHEVLVSKKSSRVNAMVTGLGPTKDIFVYDTLLRQFTPEEVEVVLAHELAHAAYGDVLTSWLLGGAGAAVTLFLAAWMLNRMIGVGPLNIGSPHAARGLALLMLMLSLLGAVTGPFDNVISRRMEVRADAFALRATGNPTAFVSGFKKLAGENPSDVEPPAVVEFLNHSHPSIVRRIQMAVRYGAK